MREDLISRCELFNSLAPVQTLGEAYAVIQDMPTVERKTGEWIEDAETYYRAVNEKGGGVKKTLRTLRMILLALSALQSLA